MLRTKGKKKKYQQNQKPRYWINERIRVPRVMVIDDEGKQIGEMTTRDALQLAKDKELDLVEVFPKSVPPVCKIMDYGQLQYQQSRKNQAQKSSIKKIEVKGIRISFKIGKHDLDVRRKQSIKFLNKGDKVKIDMILRGRERAHFKEAFEKMNDFIKSIQDEQEIIIEQSAKKMGAQIGAIISPVKN